MTFFLSSHNVFNYLIEHGLCNQKEQTISKIESKSSKNFNLLVTFPNNRHLLIKQERYNKEGKTKNEFVKEWRFHKWLLAFPEVADIKELISEVIHFDPSRFIIIFNYLDNYCDLEDFYNQEQNLPTSIASEIGKAIATVHSKTFESNVYKFFFLSDSQELEKTPNFLHGLEKLKPEIFARVTSDNFKFFKLYQRYESFGEAIAKLKNTYQRRCLIHNDLKLNNILLNNQWQRSLSNTDASANSIIRIIDWERCTWGDPAFDLGRIIASYLNIWLSSLIVSTDIDLAIALQLATTPLEKIQPSINALIQGYFQKFPEIIDTYPNFLLKVMQFTGMALLEKIQIRIRYHEPFGNRGVCMLQVAKTLLCEPERSLPIIFGTTASELSDLRPISA
ncbi:phosphotransferase [Scytonema sp. UIC 10036]|uniref:phosphotransferase n=1 Tax=Scytonema sp. UIC 10036 TaxID=2304196 RepID=UPI0012DAD0FC|nr:phosphotransferase [Scytonema sp. UIC 10036]MUH00739.1 phosphotransferase [Scytonema sp. UIC 10036]